MNPDRLIAEIAQKVEAEYKSQTHSRINPKLAALLAARLRRSKSAQGEELATVKDIAARMQVF